MKASLNTQPAPNLVADEALAYLSDNLGSEIVAQLKTKIPFRQAKPPLSLPFSLNLGKTRLFQVRWVYVRLEYLSGDSLARLGT